MFDKKFLLEYKKSEVTYSTDTKREAYAQHYFKNLQIKIRKIKN